MCQDPPFVELGSLCPKQRIRVICPARQAVLVRELRLALDPWGRVRGLLGRPPLGPGEGMLLLPCRGIHTLFMNYAIDALFLDADGRIVASRPGLPPWRLTPLYHEALATLELPAGAASAAGIVEGDLLKFQVCPSPAGERSAEI